MFDHIGFGVTDYQASKDFFLKALAPLGVVAVMEGSYGIGLGTNDKPSLWLHQVTKKPTQLHLAFAASSRHKVDLFYRAALEAGAIDNGPPGIRADYHPNYYAAFVIGPDGHNIEAVCQKPHT